MRSQPSYKNQKVNGFWRYGYCSRLSMQEGVRVVIIIAKKKKGMENQGVRARVLAKIPTGLWKLCQIPMGLGRAG